MTRAKLTKHTTTHAKSTPNEEHVRLEALRAQRILDTPPEKAFDDLTQLAADICGTPIALVSLVDDTRQWFKARVGLDAQETPRNLAFCAHTILNPAEVMQVRDAATDERFASNALVTGDPKIRFYAGAPLVTSEGFALGSLCVIDRVPRELTPKQLAALETLRDMVVRELELRRVLHEATDFAEGLASERATLLHLAVNLENESTQKTKEIDAQSQEIVRQAERLREFPQKLIFAQDAERRRLARELHDSAGQLLAAATMNIDLILLERGEMPPNVKPVAKETRGLLEQLTKEVRTVSYLLHPPLLDEAGLPTAVRIYVEGLESRGFLKIDLDVAEDLQRMSPDIELSIFRVLQECLTNVHRHSGAKSATVRISAENELALLTVEDAGSGMPETQAGHLHGARSGVGMRGMRERIRPLGGTMDVQTGKWGTRVSVRVPIVAATGPTGTTAADLLGAE